MDFIAKRVEYAGSKGTIRYFGKLLHKPRNANISTSGLWAGIVWDDPTRGNHNGVVEGVTYITPVYGPRACSLVKADKLEFGIDVLEAFVTKYFKDAEAASLLAHKDSLAEHLEKLAREVEGAKVSSKTTEFDEEAIIKTSIHFKKIEFIGWEKVWLQMKNLRHVENLSLSDFGVNSLGNPGQVAALFPSVKQLSLENNLLNSWAQVLEIQREFPKLQILWLCKNRLADPADIGQLKKEFSERFPDTDLPAQAPVLEVPHFPTNPAPFQNLQSILLLDMGLTWKEFGRFKSLFRTVEELGLSENALTDWENYDITPEDFPNLKRLDLAKNGLKNAAPLAKLEPLKLKKMNLSQNLLTDFPVGGAFREVTHLNLSGNQFSDAAIVAQLSALTGVTSLHLTGNPFLQFYDRIHIRCLVIASVPRIKNLNGSLVDRAEKRDSEIYYLKNAFHEYFRFANVSALTYDLPKFYQWARPRYPLIDAFIAKMDNPYPIEDRNLQAPPDLAAKDEAKAPKKVAKVIASSTGFPTFKFFKVEGGVETMVLSKKIPGNCDVGYLRTTVKNLLKIKTKITRMALLTGDQPIQLEGDLKKVSDFGDPQTEYRVLLEY